MKKLLAEDSELNMSMVFSLSDLCLLLCFSDLKPQNLLISESGDLKLADFGEYQVRETVFQDGWWCIAWDVSKTDPNPLPRNRRFLPLYFIMMPVRRNRWFSFYFIFCCWLFYMWDLTDLFWTSYRQADRTILFMMSLYPPCVLFCVCSGLARAKSVPSKTYSNEVVTLWWGDIRVRTKAITAQQSRVPTFFCKTCFPVLRCRIWITYLRNKFKCQSLQNMFITKYS